jgi:hypothetical protein
MNRKNTHVITAHGSRLTAHDDLAQQRRVKYPARTTLFQAHPSGAMDGSSVRTDGSSVRTSGAFGGPNGVNGGPNGVNGGPNGVNGGPNGVNGGPFGVNGGPNGAFGRASGAGLRPYVTALQSVSGKIRRPWRGRPTGDCRVVSERAGWPTGKTVRFE